MEKTTKKRRKSKRLRRRMGLIAIGGLSFVLTICLSVGATLAWFAGSTWSSNNMYMGGPVYVEMAGEGQASGSGTAWKGGTGALDIAASARNTGTVTSSDGKLLQSDGTTDSKINQGNILLPGQKLLIYSQARVVSSANLSTYQDGNVGNSNSGSNNSNTTQLGPTGEILHSNTGSTTTTTSSVLRARFSINVEFDPYVGINNFRSDVYARNYPKQTQDYSGEVGVKTYDSTNKEWKYSTATTALTWESAYGAPVLDTEGETSSRRDAIASGTTEHTKFVVPATTITDPLLYSYEQLVNIQKGDKTSIFEWKYVSETEYKKAINVTATYTAGTAGALGTLSNVEIDTTTNGTPKITSATQYVQMPKPFDGTVNSIGGNSAKVNGGSGNGYYGVWVVHEKVTTEGSEAITSYKESDAFYKARCNAYMNSYYEHYVDGYDRNLILDTKGSLTTLEDSLNSSFKDLINKSSDDILAGLVYGYDVDEYGNMSYYKKDGTKFSKTPGKTAVAGTAEANQTSTGQTAVKATWLYVDPSIGNDTNAGSSSTSVGGWWYLVESADTKTVSSGENLVVTQIDNIVTKASGTEADAGVTTFDTSTGLTTYDYDAQELGDYNKPITSAASGTTNTHIMRSELMSDDQKTAATNEYANNHKYILNAKLFEIDPNIAQTTAVAQNGAVRVVSVSFPLVNGNFEFPFVNGNFELPGAALTNFFANAKITFKIEFQALQAFFPFTPSIDGLKSGTPLAGTGKALNIGNAIPIYNEAFNYLTVM